MRFTRWFLVLAFPILVCGWSAKALADAGDLDTSFGVFGKRTLDVAGPGDDFWDAALLDDGSFIVVGRTINGTNTDVAMVKFLPNGSLDDSFGNGDGIVTKGLGKWEGGSGIHVLPNGQFLVVGYAEDTNSSDWKFLLLKYNADGSPDTNFGTGGVVTTDVSPGLDWARAVDVQDSGRIIVGGSTPENAALVGYNSNGTLDPNFGIGGIMNLGPPGLNEELMDMALLNDGRILVGGSENADQFYLARYTANGIPDNDFGENGIALLDLTPGDDRVYSMIVQPDGKIVLGGFVLEGPTDGTIDMALARFDSEGNSDPDFGIGGIVIKDLGGNLIPGNDEIFDLVLQNDGKILTMGKSDVLANDTQFLIARFLTDGTLDTTFNGGYVLTNFGNSDTATTGFITGDTLLVVGQTVNVDVEYDLALARYHLASDVSQIDDCAAALYCDLFNDGILSPDWIYQKPAWNETGGALVVTPERRKASAIAIVTYSFFNDFTIQTSMKALGGDNPIVSLLGWYKGPKDMVELMMKEATDKWILKYRVNGVTVAKAKGSKPILPNTAYSVKVSYDGSQFQVFVDDGATPLITMPATLIGPPGALGFQSKNTTASFDAIRID